MGKCVKEITNYGLKGFILHCMWRMTKNDAIKSKYYSIKAKRYFLCDKMKQAEIISDFYEEMIGIRIDINNPRTFCEYLQWIKLNEMPIEKTNLSDKYAVREWISKEIGEQYLVPIIGVWDRFDEINFDALPNQFCLKTNHGSGMNYIVKDKNSININKLKKQFEEWMEYEFSMQTFEVQYYPIKRKIIAEKYMEEMSGNLYDYKFHCFNGEPIFIQCIGDRDLVTHKGFQNNYDLEWRKLDWIFEDYPQFDYEVAKPSKLNEMIDVAKKLARDFRYVRVDLYEINGQVKFGEMTFTPSSGLYPYKGTWTRMKDEQLGDLMRGKTRDR